MTSIVFADKIDGDYNRNKQYKIKSCAFAMAV